LSSAVLPLELLSPGDHAVVEDIQGDAHWICRMAEFGLQHGCRLQVLRSGAPCLLQLPGCQLCLRSDDSMRILVRPVE
jgi:Fe2+ transport system protein FeoA